MLTPLCCSQEDLGLSEVTYELCYNAACALIGQGQLTEALSKLQQAEGQFEFICSDRNGDFGD